MSKIFFTSDTHFNHFNILKYCNRPFSNLEDMNNTIITNWNNVVSPTDTVYHLGDFIFEKYGGVDSILDRLNGHIHLIHGNHDRSSLFRHPRFASSNSLYKEIKIRDTPYILFHYPIDSWDKMYYGSIHLHGHIHSNGPATKPNRLDVGVDNSDYTPLSIEDIHLKLIK